MSPALPAGESELRRGSSYASNSAAALASAKGWKDLLIPGVLAGSFGYAIGSFIGITVVEWMRL